MGILRLEEERPSPVVTMSSDKKRKVTTGESSGKWKGVTYSRRKKVKVVPVRRPALQVLQQQWILPDSKIINISGGAVYHINQYKAGSGDDCRHANQTITYKMDFAGCLWVDDDTARLVMPIRCYFWLIYDAEPRGVLPATTDIFNMPWTHIPATWKVTRSYCHRFVIKRKWTIDLTSDGTVPGTKTRLQYPVVGGKNIVDFKKFFTKLRASTEWMNTGDGQIGDIKKGALYVVAAARQGLGSDSASMKIGVNFAAESRLYFKSVGNQ